MVSMRCLHRHHALLNFLTSPAQARRPAPAMDGTLDQIRPGRTEEGVMFAFRIRAGRRRAVRGWRYLGTGGVLQPLNQDFLYRSPHARIDGMARRRRERRHAEC